MKYNNASKFSKTATEQVLLTVLKEVG